MLPQMPEKYTEFSTKGFRVLKFGITDQASPSKIFYEKAWKMLVA